MGSKSSKDQDECNISSKLPEHIRSAVLQQFDKISNGMKAFKYPNFAKETSSYLTPDLQKTIFNSISNDQSEVSTKQFVHFAEIFFGDFEQQVNAVLLLKQPLRKVIESLVSALFACEQMDKANSLDQLVAYLLRHAPAGDCFDRTHLTAKFVNEPLLALIVGRVFRKILTDSSEKLLPELPDGTVLSPAAICLLMANLPDCPAKRWKRVFSNRNDGESFNKLLRSVDKIGPCLLIIETTNDRIFGCFASHGFIHGSSYTGDAGCFLFQADRSLAIYRASGYNTNYAYLNSKKATMPNGIGMGGYEQNWSFFLSENFTDGYCTPSMSTFESCWLAGEARFNPKNVEVWLLNHRDQTEMDGENYEQELTERKHSMNKREARLLLELSGKIANKGRDEGEQFW